MYLMTELASWKDVLAITVSTGTIIYAAWLWRSITRYRRVNYKALIFEEIVEPIKDDSLKPAGERRGIPYIVREGMVSLYKRAKEEFDASPAYVSRRLVGDKWLQKLSQSLEELGAPYPALIVTEAQLRAEDLTTFSPA